MKHQYLEFKVIHQKIQRTDSFFVVGGSVNYLKARFTFCEDWDGKEQIAIFTGGGHSYAVSLKDGECFVPWEVLRVKRFYVGCMAGERITSNAVAVDVCPCAVGDNLENPLEPTPTVLDEKIRKAVEAYMQEHPIEDSDSEEIDLSAYATMEYVDKHIKDYTEAYAEPVEGMDVVIGMSEAEALGEMDALIDGEPDIDPNAGNGNPVSGVSKAEMEAYISKRLGNYPTKAEMEASVKRSVDELVASIEIAEEGAY